MPTTALSQMFLIDWSTTSITTRNSSKNKTRHSVSNGRIFLKTGTLPCMRQIHARSLSIETENRKMCPGTPAFHCVGGAEAVALAYGICLSCRRCWVACVSRKGKRKFVKCHIPTGIPFREGMSLADISGIPVPFVEEVCIAWMELEGFLSNPTVPRCKVSRGRRR